MVVPAFTSVVIGLPSLPVMLLMSATCPKLLDPSFWFPRFCPDTPFDLRHKPFSALLVPSAVMMASSVPGE